VQKHVFSLWIPILLAKKNNLLRFCHFFSGIVHLCIYNACTKKNHSPSFGHVPEIEGFVGRSKDWVWLSENDAHFHG
jgi:hypothetical protein